MNAVTGDEPEQRKDPEIILVGLEKTNFYLVKGDDYLNQLLLVDGDFPKPVLCMNFDSLFEAKRKLGELFNPGASWGIHPDIVARLRDANALIETNA